MFKISAILVAAVCVANASITLNTLVPKPDKYKHQEGCYISELDQVIPFYSMAPSKSSCAGYTCSTNFIRYNSCDEPIDLRKGCILTYDNDKSDPYPDCCGTVECSLIL